MESPILKKLRPAGAAVMFSLVLSVPAFAEMIAGQITNINQQNNTVTVQPQDQQKFDQQNLQIKMENEVFQNSQQVQSINELSVGDQITVEADKSMFGGDWEAQSLISVQSQGGQAQTGQQGALSPQQSRQGTGTQGQSAALPEADYIVHGRVVSTDPATNSLIVTDYATGLDRTFTVMDTNILQSVQPGQEVSLQSGSEAGQSAQQSGQAQGSQALQSSSTQAGGQSQGQGTQSQGQSSGTPSASGQSQSGSAQQAAAR